MKLQASNKTLVVAIITLALINLVTLGIIWFGGRGKIMAPHAPRDARNFLVNKLNLSSQQRATFDSLREIHFTTIQIYNEDLKKLKDRFFQRLSVGNDSFAKRIASDIGIVQTKVELQTFDHFYSLRSILSDKQKTEFDLLINDVLKDLHPPGPREGRPPPGNFPPPQ